MMIATTSFIRGEATVAGKKKGRASWRAQDQSKRNALEWRSDFRGQPREGRGSSRFTPLIRTPKEILAAKAGKFKPLPPMVTPMEKRSSNKFCDFHNDKGHSTDECMQFPSLTTSSGTEGPLVIKAEIGRHLIHRMYVDRVHSTKALMNFMIVRSLSPYNGIIGRPGIREIQAVPSIAYGMLKFPVDGGIVTIRRTILIHAECVTVITSSKEIPKEAGVRHENFKVALHLNFLDQEKKRGQAPEHAKAVQTEVHKLVEAGIMREVYYHEWLSNPVMVKKHDGSWRMCVDFTDLNKAYPQDCYPLPEIDWKVESLCGYPFKCFLDAYKGYHQIQMAESDEEKTAFHTSHRVYCYTKMPFGLNNTGAMYQRLVDKNFNSQVGQNIEVYFDDLVIQSHTEA
ncbi:reverse transcriptase domain-containing protein [Tanacetum coccineum]